jgi:hypothetical protein
MRGLLGKVCAGRAWHPSARGRKPQQLSAPSLLRGSPFLPRLTTDRVNTQKEQPKNRRQTESTQRPSPSGPNQSILSACARLSALGMLASLSACAVAAGATREGGDNELVAGARRIRSKGPAQR